MKALFIINDPPYGTERCYNALRLALALLKDDSPTEITVFLMEKSSMSEKLKIAPDGWVVVCDGRKALILRNHGDEDYPNLKVQQVLEAPPNPPTHEQGTDKPPRAISGERRSKIEQTDWHRLAEHEFAKVIAKTLDHANFNALILVAPARTLADLRAALSKKTRRAIVAEIDKDLTKHPVYEIEGHLTGV